ncbi:hypothetical protein BU24DRAFT_429486, partial [Aaosphaeria arxii CBS 175.79]
MDFMSSSSDDDVARMEDVELTTGTTAAAPTPDTEQVDGGGRVLVSQEEDDAFVTASPAPGAGQEGSRGHMPRSATLERQNADGESRQHLDRIEVPRSGRPKRLRQINFQSYDPPRSFMVPGDKKTYVQCPYCDDKVVSRNNWTAHLRGHGLQGPIKNIKSTTGARFTCPYCQKDFAVTSRRKHYQNKHPEHLSTAKDARGAETDGTSGEDDLADEPAEGDPDAETILAPSSEFSDPGVGSRDLVEGLLQTYVPSMMAAHEEAIRNMQMHLEQYGEEESCFARELPTYMEEFRRVRVLSPCTLWEYRERVAAGDTFECGTFIFATAEQCTELLREAPLRLPILVPNEL